MKHKFLHIIITIIFILVIILVILAISRFSILSKVTVLRRPVLQSIRGEGVFEKYLYLARFYPD